MAKCTLPTLGRGPIESALFDISRGLCRTYDHEDITVKHDPCEGFTAELKFTATLPGPKLCDVVTWTRKAMGETLADFEADVARLMERNKALEHRIEQGVKLYDAAKAANLSLA